MTPIQIHQQYNNRLTKPLHMMSKEAFAALYGIARVEQELKLKNRLSVFMRGPERLGKAPFSSSGDVAEAVVV